MLTLANIDGELLIPLVAITGGIGIAIFAIAAGVAKSIARTRATEQSRREIAAYIAEGSMTPQEGAALLAAGPAQRRGCC